MLVRQALDEEEDLCTQINHVPSQELLHLRQALHPTIPITVDGMRERYRNLCTSDHCEAFFANFIMLVEGATERAALLVYAKHLGLNLNDLGISIVSAGGKGNLDSFFHLYSSLGIPLYTIFDNDRNTEGRAHNPALCRLLGLPEVAVPDGHCGPTYCIFEGDYEATIIRDLAITNPGWYDGLKQEAANTLGSAGKAIVARYMARRLVSYNVVPTTVRHIVETMARLVEVTLPPPIPR